MPRRTVFFAPSSFHFVSIALRICLSSIVISAAGCGGSGGSDDAGYVGQPPDDVSTEVLQRNAVSVSGDSISTALDSMVNTINNSAAVSNVLTVPGIGLSSGVSSDAQGMFNDPTTTSTFLNDDFEKRVRTESSTLFDSTMGLSGSATSTRTGNTITIDPDENDICQNQNINDSVEFTICTQLLTDLTVRIDAETDQSGLISYLFRDQVVAEVGYSPVYGSYELKLGGLHAVMHRLAELDSSADPVPETMSGSVKFEATILSETEGAEAGTFSISIPDAVSVVSSEDGTNITIGQSTLMEVSANAASGTASVDVAIGAIDFATRDNSIAGNPVQKLIMAGLTLRADLSRNGEVLTLSNVGLRNGPLVLTVDSLEAMRATLGTFGFTVDRQSTIALNGNLDFSVAISNVMGVLDPLAPHDNTASYTVSAASGTVFTELANELLRIDQGGPLFFSYFVSDGTSQSQGQVTVNQGECFGDGYQSDTAIAIAECN